MTDADNPFTRLGVPVDASEKEVKRAYARLLKQIDQARESDVFVRLRADYEAALASVRFRAQFVDMIQDTSTVPPVQEPMLDVPAEGDATRTSTPDAEASIDLQSEMRAQVDQALEQLVVLAVRDGEGEFQACEAHLRAVLATDALVSLVARDTFEVALVHALARRRFEGASGVMLVVAADQFLWRLGQFNVLRQSGEDGRYVERLLDEEAWIGANDRKQWFQLGNVQRVGAIPDLAAQREKFRKTCPQLFEYCYSETQRDEWARQQKETTFRADFGKAPPGYIYKKDDVVKKPARKEKISLAKIYQAYYALAVRQPIVGVLVGLIWLPIVVGMVLFAVSRLAGQQHTQQISRCSALYNEMASRDWHNISVDALNTLKICAKEQAPPLCSDREALQAVLGKGKRLFPEAFESGFWYLYGSQDVLFHPTSGLGYVLKDTASCDVVLSLIKTSNWMNFGDAKASIELVRRAAMCEGQVKSREDLNQIAWLKQLAI